MREIKFRGKEKNTGIWCYGDLIRTTKTATIVAPNAPQGTAANYTKIRLDDTCMVDPKTVGQYTGLKDKNGKEIYEGDILRYSYSRDTTGTDIITDEYPVEWYQSKQGAGFDLPFIESAEVVGNIYEAVRPSTLPQ